MFASITTLFALLAGDGLAGNVSDGIADPSVAGPVPVIDIPTPQAWGTDDVSQRGGRAALIELDDQSSTWYRLTYIDGGDRLQVFEQYAASTLGSGFRHGRESDDGLASSPTKLRGRTKVPTRPTVSQSGLGSGLATTRDSQPV